MNAIETFEHIAFHGQFRPYQQRVLDHFQTHARDKRIHIVAAPGSGKTVLGLELIRRLGQPALVLSPTVVIQHQWGQRFEELFLPDDDASACLSYDLRAPALITSLTYQGLYAAWNRLVEQVADDGEDEVLNYEGFDLLAAMHKAGIRTICLDEAHHLKAAWQRALEQFVAAVKNEVTIISLTATPPYDSTPAEWARYLSLCGDIDDEISAPTLVQQGILCPHQDFVYLNRPTQDEEAAMLDFRHRAWQCVREVVDGPLLFDMLEAGHALDDTGTWTHWRYYNTKGVQALLVLAAYKSIAIPRGIAGDLFYKGRVPEFSLANAQAAFQFVLDNPDTFGTSLVNALGKKLAGAGLLVRKKVCLETDAALNRRLAGSAAKLAGIGQIAAAEQANLGSHMRMLALTDYIGRQHLPVIGGSAPLSELDAVSVFEAVRRGTAPGTPIAILTGSLVVAPASAMAALRQACDMRGIAHSSRILPGADVYEITFGAGNRQKVAVLTALFKAGDIQVLVGTKALLGEGWDSPCINSLVLASFVGSFVLSNQMRGRAIRTDPQDTAKVSNIWHLATVMPPPPPQDGLQEPMESGDMATLARRFECFMAPSYSGGAIESGLSRVDILKPPYDQLIIADVNRQMLALAADRAGTAAAWHAALPIQSAPEILDTAAVPYEAAPPHFVFSNVLHASALTGGLGAVIGFLWVLPQFVWSWKWYLAAGAACLVATGLLLRGYYLVLRLASPKRYIRALACGLLETLQELGEISTPGARFVMEYDAHGIGFSCALAAGSLREKKLFADALAELLSPFDSPRYLIVRQRRILFWHWNDFAKSYACPAVIANNAKNAAVFGRHLAKAVGRFRLLFTGNAREQLLKSLKQSYINRNGAFIESKRLVRRGYGAAQIVKPAKAKALANIRRFLKNLLPNFNTEDDAL